MPFYNGHDYHLVKLQILDLLLVLLLLLITIFGIYYYFILNDFITYRESQKYQYKSAIVIYNNTNANGEGKGIGSITVKYY